VIPPPGFTRGGPMTPGQWRERARWLGIPDGWTLCRAILTGPSGELADTLRLELLDPDDKRGEIARPGAEPIPVIRAHGRGYRWEMFGVPWRQPPIGHPSFARLPRTYVQTPHVLPDSSGHRLGLECWHAFGWFDGSPIYAELIWSGEPPAADWTIHGLGRPASDDEWRRAKRTLTLLQLKIGAGGRPRTEDTDDGKIALGRDARALKRANPHWSYSRIAGELGAIDYENYTDDKPGDRRAQRVAGQNIKRLIDRVNEIDPLP
jgi:hypothetical protein